MKVAKRIIAENWPTLARDVTGIVGAALIAFGAWEIYAPAGVICAGIFLFGFAWLMARNEEQ